MVSAHIFNTSSLIKPYVSLTKPRITSLVLVTTTTGFFFGTRGIHLPSLLFLTLLGTALSCGGAAALNNYLERDIDSKMKRTCGRPIPCGVVPAAHALAFGILLVLLGTAFLSWKVNLLCGFLALLTAFLYVLVYTPLKRVTWLNTFIGAIPGAIPPLGGWAASTGKLDLGAWILFGILFLWQHPHFYSIAWMFKDDYRKAGLKMLPAIEPDGKSTFRQIIIYSILLIPVSLLPTFIGMSGMFYFTGVLILGLFLLYMGIALARIPSLEQARKLLKASIIYLPVLLILIVCDAKL